MIVTITKGRSLRGLGMYLLHDKREAGAAPGGTAVRVAWTHTHNLSEADPHQALREMIATAQAQPLLQRMAGHRPGRPTKDSVLHVALSFEPTEQPTKAQMIEVAESYLRHMGWHAEFQVLMACHTDTAHSQVHLAINRISPLTGLTIDDKWYKNDTQKWALQYQEARGQDFCKERKNRAEGKPYKNTHMPRWQYDQWKKTDLTREEFLARTHGQAETARATQADDARGRPWDDLKARQKAERQQFFQDTKAGTKGLRAEVWQAVKQETAPRWQGYARQRELAERERKGAYTLLRQKLRVSGYKDWARQLHHADRQHASELKAGLQRQRAQIQADQSARFAQVNERAFQGYQATRAEGYQALLARQQAERHQLHAQQRVEAQPTVPATPAQLAEARAKAIVEAMRARPEFAHLAKAAPNAEPPAAARSAATGKDEARQPAEQGPKPMPDARRKQQEGGAPRPAGPSVFTTQPAPPTVKSAREEASAHAREHRGYEQQSRSADIQHAQQFGSGPNYVDPNATAKAEHAKWEAERRAEQKAREDAAQPYRGRPLEVTATEQPRPAIQPPPASQVPRAPVTIDRPAVKAAIDTQRAAPPSAPKAPNAAYEGREQLLASLDARARTRTQARSEVTDRLTEQAARPTETSDRKQALTDREAFLQSLDAQAKARANSPDRGGGRDR